MNKDREKELLEKLNEMQELKQRIVNMEKERDEEKENKNKAFKAAVRGLPFFFIFGYFVVSIVITFIKGLFP